MGLKMTKYEFGSPEWFACLHGIAFERAATAAAKNPDVRFSMCEVLTGVPPSLSKTGTLAWHVVIRGTEFAFGATERDDVDMKYIADFEAVRPLAHYDTMDKPERVAELGRLVEGLMKDGKLKLVGGRSAGSGDVGSFHDAIVRLTA
jgi:hypothetical protein